MKKTEQIIILILARDHIEPHPDFPKVLSKLIIHELFGLMGDSYDIKRVDSEKPHIRELLSILAYLISYDQIKSRHAKEILNAAWKTTSDEWDIGKYILDKKMFDEVDLDDIIESVIKEETKAWEDYCSGKKQSIGRLIGSIMRKTNGKADPQEAKKRIEVRSGL